MPPWCWGSRRAEALARPTRGPRAKLAPHIAERVLGHTIPGVEGVYDRYSYADEKADALARLAGLVELITSPPEGNVMPLAPVS